MRAREYLQESQDDMGTAGTLTYPLDFSDPITEINLRFAATNGASSCKNNPIERNITRIEIVDGGEVLWSLPGDVALAAWSHFADKMPNMYRTGAPSDGPVQCIPIRFGRYLYDPEYAFNPVAHRNPQLKVTFDEATVAAASATAYVTDSFTVDVLVRLMEDAAPPVGFLSCREIETYAALASGNVVTRLPSDRMIRALLVRNYESGEDFRGVITQYKLSSDGGKFVAFDLPVRSMCDIMTEQFKPLDVPFYTVTDDSETHQTWVGLDLIAHIHGVNPDNIVTCDTPWKSQLYVQQHDNVGDPKNAYSVYFTVRGWALHNTLIYPFGRLDVPEEWFNPQGLQNLDLIQTQGNADGEVNVCLQQLHGY